MRSKAAFRPLGLGLALFALIAGPASAETETRQVGPFHAISMEGSWAVDVTVGRDESVVIEGDKAMLDRVKTTVEDGTLDMHAEHGVLGLFSGHSADLVAHVTVPRLDHFELSGSGIATIGGLDGGALGLDLNGSGMLKAKGQVDKVTVTLSGAGKAELADLAAETVAATINGSGDMVVWPHRALDATINGSGAIQYLGDPAHLTSAIHGSGSIGKQ